MSLEVKLNYHFKTKSLLAQAMAHRSFANESGTDVENNEKLEFLGDAVLDLLVAEYLLEKFPTAQEGELSKYRAYLVNETSLATQAMGLGLPEFIKLGKSERIAQGEIKPRLLSSALEAVIGAIYLDGGLQPAKVLVRSLFKLEVKSLKDPAKVLDYKTELQEIIQSERKVTPTYAIINEEGPSHDPKFTAALKVGEEILAVGSGKTKKLAEQNAAEIYLTKIKSEKAKVETSNGQAQEN